MHKALLIGVVSFCIAAGASAAASCPVGLKSMSEAELFFGRGGVSAVTNNDWQQFLSKEITPRFPDGLTVEDGAGQWRNASSAIIREASKHLIIVLPGAPDDAAKLAAIRKAYKQRFRQESVMLLEHEVCGSF